MRTKEKLDGLVADLSANCGDLFAACRTQAVSPMFVAQWRKDDKDVDATLTEAEAVGAMQLESVAINRAWHGVEKGVWYQGEQVGSETQYSDSLLTTLMKHRLEKYKSGGEAVGNTFNGPTQINIMPRAANYEEWLTMKDSTNARKSLPAPVEQVIDAEFTQVTEHEKSLAALADIMCHPPQSASPELAGLGL